MTYIGVIASAVLHVGGLFLLLSARAPEPMQPLGGDTPLDVSIISVEEYNALTSRAPQSSTLAALREQPETPQQPEPIDLDPQVDTTPEEPEVEPEVAVELAMNLPPPEPDIVPEIQDEPEQPDSSEVAVAPAPPPIAVEPEALQDRQVDPNDLIPNDDVSVAMAPPAPKPPRGVFDAPVIDMTPDEPPAPSETEGEGQETAEEAAPPPPEQAPEPVQVAEADDPAPLSTPMPIPKPRGSLAVASEQPPVPAPAQIAETTPPPAPPRPVPAPAPAPAAETPEPSSQLSEAEMEQERRMMAALMEQMRASQPPTAEEQRAAEAEALRELAEEQARREELAALSEAERRAAEEADRKAREEAQRITALAAQELARAQQEAALQAQRAAQEAARQAAFEEQRRLQEQRNAELRREAERQQAERDRQRRVQMLAELNSDVSPETTANNVLTGTVPSPTAPSAAQSIDDRFASMLSTAGNFASQASTGPSFSQGGGVRQGASLTPGETEAVLNQLRRCWRVDTFSANARSQVVTLRAQIRQNGFVNQATIQVAAPLPTPPEYRIAVERAISALQDRRCQPFALPPAKYNAWRDIVIRFDPAQMVLQ